MLLGIFKYSDDYARNVARRNRGEPTVRIEGHHVTALANEMGDIEQPLGEEGDAKVRCWNARPIENLLGEPMSCSR
jgi:hypothetical protein